MLTYTRFLPVITRTDSLAGVIKALYSNAEVVYEYDGGEQHTLVVVAVSTLEAVANAGLTFAERVAILHRENLASAKYQAGRLESFLGTWVGDPTESQGEAYEVLCDRVLALS